MSAASVSGGARSVQLLALTIVGESLELVQTALEEPRCKAS